MNSSKTEYIYPAFVFAAAFVVYAGNLSADLVIDDRHLIINNPWIKDAKYIPAILSSSVWSFQDIEGVSNHYRPLYLLYYMATYFVFGLKTWAFHLANNLFHSVSAVIVYLIGLRFFSDSAKEHAPPLTPRAAALFSALIFALHPVNTEAVTWVAAVSEVSFALFFFASLYLYMTSAPSKWGSPRYWLSVVAFALSAFSKETAAALPFVLIAYDLTIVRVPVGELKRWARNYAPFFIIGVLYLLARSASLGGIAPMKGEEGMTGGEMALNFLPMIGHYLYKVLLPVNLIHYEFLDPVKSTADAWVVVPAIALVSFFVIGVLARRASSFIPFSLLLFFLPLLPVLLISVLKGHPALAERYLYISSAAFGMLAVAAVSAFARRAGGRGGVSGAAAALAVLLVLYSYGTVERNRVWASELSIWQDTVAKAPRNKYAHNNLGIEFVRRGDVEGGISEFRTALSIDPLHHSARNNLGIAFAKSGDMEGAIREFRFVLARDPGNPDARRNLEKALGMIR